MGEEPGIATRPRRLPQIARGLGVVVFSCALISGLIVLFARWSPVAEIASHFRVFYALAAASALALFVWTRNRRWCVASSLVLIWQVGPIAGWYLPPAQVASSGFEGVALSINVNADTDGYSRVLELLAREKPDLLFIQELSPAWAKAFERIHADYPFRILNPRQDIFGLGFYSRFPIENAQTTNPTTSDVPVSRGDVVIGKSRVHIVNVHFFPPENRLATERRYKQFAWLTGYLGTYRGPVLVAGDLNCTMWSPLYHDLACRGRLTNAREGRGVLPSWNFVLGMPPLIPIDHLLGGGGITFEGARIGPDTGSDHRSIISRFRLAE